jgi:hypothetical protein
LPRNKPKVAAEEICHRRRAGVQSVAHGAWELAKALVPVALDASAAARWTN